MSKMHNETLEKATECYHKCGQIISFILDNFLKKYLWACHYGFRANYNHTNGGHSIVFKTHWQIRSSTFHYTLVKHHLVNCIQRWRRDTNFEAQFSDEINSELTSASTVLSR